MLTYTKKVNNNIVTFLLNGRLDANTAGQLDDSLKELADNTCLVLDFTDLAYISSAGLRVLLSAQKRLKSNGDLKLINVTADVMEILEVTGFTDILNVEQ